ncbi:von willebrand factor type a [Pseudochryseolinea flava]|uniref:von willebrand factor type a n=2 Tax=Pseudochryseolinea flava TaxID=2059302 RepID=A0A364XZA0_9BACT|nr:von willebrand factor type a [Pseudochryseolinea flava]
MRNVRLIIISTIFFIVAIIDSQAQHKVQQKIPEKTRILFLLDGSGSMLENWGRPHQTKMSMAKIILSQIIDSLKQNKNLELALRVYGHRSPREQNNCKDTQLEAPFKANNHQLIIDKINDIKPKGVTPITYSLEQAALDFPANPGYRNIVILITDGIESCGGDICATSRALQAKGIFLRPYIIGLGLRAEENLNCAGKFINADTPGKFHDILNDAIEKSFSKTTVSVELLDAQNQPRESNVNIMFINTTTNMTMYDFIHYRDAQGNPDTVQIDPVVDYDLIVSTIPQTVVRSVSIKTGSHNVIRIPVPQGNLRIEQEGRKNDALESIVRQKGEPGIIMVQKGNAAIRYLIGKYEVETLTFPRRKFQVEVQSNKTQVITLPPPGVVNVNTVSPGYGSLYEMKSDGSWEWVTHLNDLKSQFTLNLLPGTYKIVFRVKNTTGSKYSAYKIFQLKSGETKLVKVFG